ncbi:hypothetical protein F4806DRAFT_505470 [Annulohypoxylon nitens]|nr:hypothetical protein F4806DRAFT_505470 [Annulohypoxylon nitens]
MPSYKRSGFQFFPRLPAELRIMIWREALEFESRTQCIQVHPLTNFEVLLPRRETVTRIIWACSESRALADEFYPHILAVYPPGIEGRIKSKGCIRINLERVTLVQLRNTPLACPERCTRTPELSQESQNLVHKISVVTSIRRRDLHDRLGEPLSGLFNLTSYKIVFASRYVPARYFRKAALHNFTRHIAGPGVPQPGLLRRGRLTARCEKINGSHSITFIPSSPQRWIEILSFLSLCDAAIDKIRQDIAAESS